MADVIVADVNTASVSTPAKPSAADIMFAMVQNEAECDNSESIVDDIGDSLFCMI